MLDGISNLVQKLRRIYVSVDKLKHAVELLGI